MLIEVSKPKEILYVLDASWGCADENWVDVIRIHMDIGLESHNPFV